MHLREGTCLKCSVIIGRKVGLDYNSWYACLPLIRHVRRSSGSKLFANFDMQTLIAGRQRREREGGREGGWRERGREGGEREREMCVCVLFEFCQLFFLLWELVYVFQSFVLIFAKKI